MNPIVETQSGKIEGVQLDHCVRFLAIPYAKPPLGELRFRRTQKIDHWEGVYKADKFIAKCPQPTGMFSGSVSSKIIMSEDCLTLNIWTPACDNKKRPLMFWIHGGGFLTGEASQIHRDGTRLCAEGDMVVVSIQYRLGAFGFYDFTQLKGARGMFDVNCGMYDQVTALEWVRDNISCFGGDPGNITAMGESAGAMSVQTLVTIPRVKGLIKKVVLESTVWDGALSKENAKISALTLLQELNLSEDEAWKIAEVSAEVLVSASKRVDNRFVDIHPLSWAPAPVIDGELIPASPYDLILDGCLDGVKLLIGTTKDEASMFVHPKGASNLPYSKDCMDKFFALNPQIDQAKMLSVYPGYPSLDAIKELGKDMVFHIGSIYMADAVSKSAPVFMYRFDYVTPLNKMLKLGAMHTEEVLYVCGKHFTVNFMFDLKNGRRIAEDTHVFWRNFVKYGNPNGLGEAVWPEYGEERKTFIFDKKYSVICDPSHETRIALQGVRAYGSR